MKRTHGQITQLEKQIYDVLSEDFPLSIRHVFYKMTDPRLPEPIEKSDRGYRQLQNRLTVMRRNGTIPYSWLTDATRRGYHVPTFINASEFLDDMVAQYRGDLWGYSENYVEVWVESRSIAGVIENVCEKYAVSLYPAGGFTSISLVVSAAKQIEHFTGHGKKPAQVIYIGDYDPAGILIDKSIENEFYNHLPPEINLVFHRIAINENQIERYDLPTKPRKEGDRRVKSLTHTVEAESLEASILRELLIKKIESFLPANALRITAIAEQSEREGLQSIANALEHKEPQEIARILGV